MMLRGKVAVIFGGSGAIGRSVALMMAREGAQVWLLARKQARLDNALAEVRAAGFDANALTVDVLSEQSTLNQTAKLAQQTGGIDIIVNVTGFMHDQGKGILELSLSEFRQRFDPFLSAMFNISKAVAPHMGGERAGVILTVVAPAEAMVMPNHLGHIVGCAGTEAFVKSLASELGPKSIRVVGVRAHAIVDAVAAGSYTTEIFAPKARHGSERGSMAGRRKARCLNACRRLLRWQILSPFSHLNAPAP